MQDINLTIKHYLALVAVMLLPHAIPYAIRMNNLVLTDEEKQFVSSYMHIGKLFIYILLGTCLVWLAFMKYDYKRMSIVSNIASIIVILSICLCIYAIVRDTNIAPLGKLDIHALKSLFTRQSSQ